MTDWLEQYERIPTTAHGPRRGVVIDTVVWHWTGGWREAESVARIDYQRKKNRVSAHFTIGRDGKVIQSVPLSRAAWHAGHTDFLDGRNVNRRSIGVEVCNRGFLRGNDITRPDRAVIWEDMPHRNPAARRHKWEAYTAAQRDAIEDLCDALEAAIPTLRYHTGHEDILNRQHTKGAKLDPGPAFPWHVIGSDQAYRVAWDYEERDWLHMMDPTTPGDE